MNKKFGSEKLKGRSNTVWLVPPHLKGKKQSNKLQPSVKIYIYVNNSSEQAHITNRCAVKFFFSISILIFLNFLNSTNAYKEFKALCGMGEGVHSCDEDVLL